jgi:hypothetical protein
MHQVKITMTATTVTALVASKNYLYASLAVQSSDRAGRPLIWQQNQSYSTNTIISWDGYQAYTSSNQILEQTVINVGFYADIAPGQVLSVGTGGTGTAGAGGPAGDVSILNTTKTQFTCGLSRVDQEGSFLPYCAFPLYGLNLQQITPLDKVLLTFSTEPLPPGTVIGSALGSLGVVRLASYTSSLLVDLTRADERDVTYDLNAGWSWDGSSWAQLILAGADLVPLLIEPVPSP